MGLRLYHDALFLAKENYTEVRIDAPRWPKEVSGWCDKYCLGKYALIPITNQGIYGLKSGWFREHKDAVLFALRWS